MTKMRLAELCQRNVQKWGSGLVAGARQDDARRIAFLEQHGFRYSGQFAEVNMLRSLDEPIPEFTLPTGCQNGRIEHPRDTILPIDWLQDREQMPRLCEN